MRLIDADALIAQMEADAEHIEEPIAKMFVYAAINDVKHAPTIEERKVGHWIIEEIHSNWDDWTNCTCPICGKKFTVFDPSNFCPNCGARMRGEHHETY